MKKLTLLILVLFVSSSMFAEQKIVKGRVLLNDDFALGNIVVSAKKSKAIVSTNNVGEFSIACEENDVLQFKSKSFYSQKESVKGLDSLRVYLKFRGGDKNVEAAIAEGYLTEEGINYIVKNLSNTDNDFSTYASVFDLLRGKFNGVEILGNEVRIRGSSSLNGNNAATFVVNGSFVNDISDILPSNIKTIKVLKSTESAIYGSRGLNGVIVIVTKSR